MKSKNSRASTPKRFEDLLPKLDNGSTDWETVQKRASQNIDAMEMLLGKLPPQALEIEAAILGACLIDGAAFKKVNDVLAGFSQPFYTDAHNALWDSMVRLNEKNEPIDRLTVFQELEKMQKTGIINGNPYYLIQLTENVSSSAHVESHSRILLEKCLRRRIMHQSIKLFQKVFDFSTDLFEVMDEHKFEINKLTELNPMLKGIPMTTVMEQAALATDKSFLVGSLIKLEEVAKELRDHGASEDEIYRMRAAATTPEAAARLAQVDREESQWKLRIATYLDDKNKLTHLENGGVDQALAIQRIRDQKFTQDEQKRLTAYE